MVVVDEEIKPRRRDFRQRFHRAERKQAAAPQESASVHDGRALDDGEF
jgi:hypothetical protein